MNEQRETYLCVHHATEDNERTNGRLKTTGEHGSNQSNLTNPIPSDPISRSSTPSSSPTPSAYRLSLPDKSSSNKPPALFSFLSWIIYTIPVLTP